MEIDYLEQDRQTYICTLDAASLERAKKELNEDEKNRDGAVETLRTWVLQQKWLNTPTEYSFLLRFLRTKKFSQLEARKTLENFWRIRTKDKLLYSDKDLTDPKIIDLLKMGFLLRLPHADKEGRIWLINIPGNIDIDKVMSYGVEYYFKTYSIVYDWVMMDERAQVNGIGVIVDNTGTSMKHSTTVYSPTNMMKLMELVMGVYPIRVKIMNVYNIPPIIEFLMDLALSFMTKKMKERLVRHKTLVTIYDSMEKDLLPNEYLPDNQTGRAGSVNDVVDYMINELTSEPVMKYIYTLSNQDYKVDMDQKPDDLPAESFRKLNID